MLTLAQYLVDEKLTLEIFAGRIGRTAATVSRIARGRHKPDWDTMEAIERATGGKVTPNSFRDAEPIRRAS